MPRTYECTACGWSKTVAPKSDALAEGYDHFKSCPKCGNENLASRPANAIKRFWAEIFDGHGPVR
jgi:predicted RNA-binding Zn-ribbon protein involved in translation (DUF1610 family)